MMSFLKKLFGGKKELETDVENLVKDTLEGIIERGSFEMTYKVSLSKSPEGESTLSVELFGNDEELLKEKKGALLDSIQLLVKRVLQHRFPDDRTNVNVDCGGYREETEAALIERAESLKVVALEEGKSVYYRALPPKDRKVVHQYLAKDPRIKSRSLGDGLYKKIKI
jgi:spoIIIJ-associated protein